MVRKLIIVVVLILCTASSARAEWLRSSELTFGTAHTLPPGSLEVGLLSPLQFGISDRLQLGIHPIMLLVGAINGGFRFRVTPARKTTVSIDVDASLSLLNRENLKGEVLASDCNDCGFPSRIRALSTVSIELGSRVLLSLGGGAAIDLVEVQLARAMMELHGSLIWRIDNSHLLMLHGSGYIGVHGEGTPTTPTFQLMLARASGRANIGIGVAFGDFIIGQSLAQAERWLLYPVLDIWWRF